MAQGKTHKRPRKGRIVLVVALVLVLLAFPLFSFAQRWAYPIRYEQPVQQWAAEYGVDPYLVYAVIRTESGFRPGAESAAGARGLMQMTDETFEWIAGKIAPEAPYTFDDLFEPEVAIRFGVYFLSLCLERYEGDVATAAAAYHSGWGTVDGLLEQVEYSQNGVHLTSFPYDQMHNYVRKITSSYSRYLALYAG